MKTTQLKSGHILSERAIVFLRKEGSRRLKQRIVIQITDDETLYVCTMSGLTKHYVNKSEVHTFINPVI